MTASTRVHSPAGRLSRELAGHLEHRGIASQISECEGIALVGIWAVGLLVWCVWGPDGWRFSWCISDLTAQWRRLEYTSCPCSAMETAARRIAELYRERYERLYATTATTDQR